MKRIIVVCMCVVLVGAAVAFAATGIVNHSGKRGVSGFLGNSDHVWAELWVNEAHFPKRIAVPIGSVFIDGGNDIDDASAPNITTVDNVGAIVYDDSTETAEIQFGWAPSSGYVSGMQIEVVLSSSVADGTDKGLDWSIFVHDNDVAFDTAIGQTAVAFTSTTLDASIEVVTLTLNSTGEAAITAGSSNITIALFQSYATGGTDGTVEIKAITILEP